MDVPLKSDLIKQIKRYQNYILSIDHPENDVPKVLHSIRKLAKLPIRLEELEKTGVGKTVNALRKCNGTVAEEATLLVAKWKSIVKKQVEEEEKEGENEEKSISLKLNCKESFKPNHSNSSYEQSSNDGEQLESNYEHESKKIRDDHNLKQEFGQKSKVHLITIKNKNSNESKRKYFEETDDIDSKKHKKLKESGSHLPNSFPEQFHSDIANMTLNRNDDLSNDSKKTITELEKVKKKHGNYDKKHKKNHEKRHHKSNKHEYKDTKYHRHHSKSSHHEKKCTEEKVKDRTSKSKLKHDSKKQDKKIHKINEKSSETKSKMKGKQNTVSDSKAIEHCMEAGDNFGAALLSIPHATSPNKKRSISSKSSIYQDSVHSSSPQKSITDFDLFSNNMKLEPLDLDEYDFQMSSNGNSQMKMFPQQMKSEDDMLNSMIVTKNQRTKVFSGNKSCNMKFPTLFEYCTRVLQENFDALEYTGGVPYDVLKPILEKVSVQQLYTFENYNPYLIGETDELWEYHVKKEFRKAERTEYESWRDLYLRCVEEREEKLQSLTENISQAIANSTPVRKTKLAYIDTVVKPPRNVARSQAKHGTGTSNSKSSKSFQSSSTAGQSVKDRLVKEAMAPNAIQIPSKSNLLVKKKKAPLMQKTLQLFKGLKR